MVKEVTKGIYPANFEVDWAKDIVEGDLWKKVSEEEELELQPFDTFGVTTEKMPAERDFELHLEYEKLYVCILCNRLCTLEEFKKVDRSLRRMIEAEALLEFWVDLSEDGVSKLCFHNSRINFCSQCLDHAMGKSSDVVFLRHG